MKGLSFLIVLIVLFCPSLAMAELPTPSILTSELASTPDFSGLNVYNIDDKVENSALGEHGILTLLQLTPKTAEKKFGKPEKIQDIYEGKGKSYEFSNGIHLSFFKDKLATIYYYRPAGVNLPYKASSVAWLGLTTNIKPDFANEHTIRWNAKPGEHIKEISINPGPKENNIKMTSSIIVSVFSPEY